MTRYTIKRTGPNWHSLIDEATGKARALSTRFLHCRFSAGCATS